MTEQTREEWLGDVLNSEIPVITELADLPSLWRETPTEGFDLNRPGDLTRLEWLAGYIYLADTEPWARDGLCRLLRELLENGEPVPALLGVWALLQYAQGDPAPKRGRPEDSERDFRVLAVYTLLRFNEYSREDAMGLIADRMFYAPETVRSIIRKDKYKRHLPFR